MKKFISKVMCASFATTAVFAAAAVPAQAEFPNKPVQFIVPWPPGDMEDVLTRMIAEDFQKAHGQPAAVVNKPGKGAGPFPGAAEVAKADADGHTIGSFVIGVPIVGPRIGMPELAPNPFEPVGIFLTYPFVLAASKDAPYQSMKELAEHAKSNKVILGHFGAPLIPTKVSLAMAKNMGFSYASDAAFDALDCNTIASGDVDVMNTTIQLVLPCLDKINILAAVTDERISLVPDAPTVKELDPSLPITLWNGLFVHKDVPADARAKIEAVAKKTMASARAQEFAKKTGAQVYWKGAADSQAQIDADTAAFDKLNAMLE
ncbi:MAG: tripartite tricarboxylate transporter substrate binding protein [Rhizobiaceae bacterium]